MEEIINVSMSDFSPSCSNGHLSDDEVGQLISAMKEQNDMIERLKKICQKKDQKAKFYKEQCSSLCDEVIQLKTEFYQVKKELQVYRDLKD